MTDKIPSDRKNLHFQGLLKAIVVGIHTNFRNFSRINFIVLISREESITWSQELLRKVLSADSKL